MSWECFKYYFATKEFLMAKHVVDLFAGCGGLSLGLEKAGFKPVFVNELNKDAMSSYLRNRKEEHPELSHQEFHAYDIKDFVNKNNSIKDLKSNLKAVHGLDAENGELDLLVGGPPCQGFSGIGHRRSFSVDKCDLPSNHLYQDMAWMVHNLNPKIFLFENVKGLLSSRWTKQGVKGEIFKDVVESFGSLRNYHIQHALIHAKDYGTPQNRPRVLLVGVRKDIDLKAWIDEDSGVANGFLPKPTNNPPDLIDLLGDLVNPNFAYGGSDEKYLNSITNDIQRYFRTRPDGSLMPKNSKLTDQEYSNHSLKVIKKFEYMLENNGLISEEFRTKKFAQRLLPKRWDPKIGPNITATSLADDYVHFSQARVLTVREWARLQGFPDWYEFSGKRTTGGLRRAGNPKLGIFDRELPKYTQIGNAVPVFLAEKLGEHFNLIL